jgi:GrpB-like predicted nucleotidyltransferase (UPF0157 family)
MAKDTADESRDQHAPLSEDYLRAHTVGELQPLTRPIDVVDYDPGWPRQFEDEEKILRSALGEHAVRIEHVGSTSVPGLAAKPVIDIVLVVADSSREAEYAEPLAGAGYQLRIREPEWWEHRMFNRPGKSVNLHVFSAGCPEIDRMLLFRDWLRNCDADRESYARLKRELAEQEWKYTQNYADAKTALIAEILSRAQQARGYGFNDQ